MKEKSNFLKKAILIKSIKNICKNEFNISLDDTYHGQGNMPNHWNIILNSNDEKHTLYSRLISNLTMCKNNNIKRIVFRYSDSPNAHPIYTRLTDSSYIFYFDFTKEEIKQINNFFVCPNYNKQIIPDILVNVFLKSSKSKNLLNTYKVQFSGLLSIDNTEWFSDLKFTHVAEFESEVPYFDTVVLPDNPNEKAKLSLQLLLNLKSNNLLLLNSTQLIANSKALEILNPLIQLTKLLSNKPPVFIEKQDAEEYSKLISDYWLITLDLQININKDIAEYEGYNLSFNTLISESIKDKNKNILLSYISEQENVYTTEIFKNIIRLLNKSFNTSFTIKNDYDLSECLNYIKLFDY